MNKKEKDVLIGIYKGTYELTYNGEGVTFPWHLNGDHNIDYDMLNAINSLDDKGYLNKKIYPVTLSSAGQEEYEILHNPLRRCLQMFNKHIMEWTPLLSIIALILGIINYLR